MKTIHTLCLIFALVGNVAAQGTIDVGNNFGATVFRAPIYGPETDIFVRKMGQSGPPAFPTGTTVYTGERLMGTGYTFGFYASTTGITTDPSALVLIGTILFRTNPGTAGFVATETFSIPGVAAGSSTTWQIRVWDNLNNTVGFDDSPFRGETPLVNSGPLGGVYQGAPLLSPNTAGGWTSFNIAYVPEPNLLTPASLGMLLWLVRRGRNRPYGST